MNFSQKFAIVSGSAASFIVLLVFCIYAQNYFETNPPPGTSSIGAVLFLIWIISLSIPIGAFFVFNTQSRRALITLSAGVVTIVVIFGFLGLLMMIWSVSAGMFLLSPVVLSLLTMFISMVERTEASRRRRKRLLDN